MIRHSSLYVRGDAALLAASGLAVVGTRHPTPYGIGMAQWGPNTLIKQGAKLVATWEDVWEELPSQVKQTLEANWAPATESPANASLFGNEQLSAQEKKVFGLLKADEATQIDELVEKLEPGVSSSEIFVALFELELAGKIKQLPGKNFVRSF